MAPKKLLITGATGYIGGSVLAGLQASSNVSIKELSISALVRKQTQADILKTMGVNPILFKDFSDTEFVKKVASEHDIVLNTAVSFNPGSAKAFILGLAERQKATGKEVHYIHTSGTSSLGDNTITKKYLHPEGRVFSDKEDIYPYLKEREAIEAYGQRTTDIAVVETGKDTGVKTYINMSPTIYGVGTGAFNKLSIQVPMMMRKAIESRVAQCVGDGSGVWDHVHIADLVDLYEIMLAKVLAGENIGSGREGFYFNSVGRHSWFGVAQAIGKVGYELGALDTPTPVPIPMEEAGIKWHGGNAQVAELGFASTSMTSDERSRELGWKPTKTEDDWNKSIKEEFEMVLEESKKSKA
ncbi:NAD dependent epimerase/dehydratase [Coniochaeta ligniaria NRRL 30616]|uniref:NAD dependent epimerase/dehydratase n=1 Tax=Coniochaeta ligniaria NRRL 30616 TaxID=1408157 RepID=A0A1J7ID50_9PEZI|nr:NAD dependent epimerase/dehydratase [Coniochaeta ligniaria NRRL 30616]